MKEKKQGFLSKIINLIRILWEKESIRFIFVGGLNTLVGVIVTFIFRHIFESSNIDPEIFVLYYQKGLGLTYNDLSGVEGVVEVLYVDIPYLINFIGLLPFAYTTQTLIAFRTKWSFKRFLRYPLSSIPNLILTSLLICLFSGILGINPYISYILAPVVALPAMFFIIRFLVKPIKGKKINEQE